MPAAAEPVTNEIRSRPPPMDEAELQVGRGSSGSRRKRDIGGREDSVTKRCLVGTPSLRTSPCGGDAIRRYQYDRRIISGRRTPIAVLIAWIKEFDMSFWDVILSIIWFMILFAWISLLFTIFADLFRDHELSG